MFVQLIDVAIVVLQAAHRPMTLGELAEECQQYVEEFVSYFDVKQVCLSLFVEERVSLCCGDPLTFEWPDRVA
jgi:hypothetical protein